MGQLAGAVAAAPRDGEIPIALFNPLGMDLPDTAIVEIDDPSGGSTDYQVRMDDVTGPVQRSSDGTLLFQVPAMRSMAIRVVYLVPAGPAAPPGSTSPATEDVYRFGNGTVELSLSKKQGWAIAGLTIGGASRLGFGDTANLLELWNDTGNIYQFGNEFTSGCSTGELSRKAVLQGGDAKQIEAGPVRWRFAADLSDGAYRYTTQYDLVRGETLVRITTAGAAPQYSSVLASFKIQGSGGQLANTLEYGTSYHWENRDPQQSWSGPTFRASHDFAELVTPAGEALAAVYHNGIPAWTLDSGTLRGCLLRNTPGSQRAASGTDSDSHTQRYTLDVGPRRAVTGQPLQTALYASTPIFAAVVGATTGTLPEAAQLASVSQRDAGLRVAKIDPPTTEDRSLILRIHQARNDSQPLSVDLPFLRRQRLVVAEIVTTLETAPDRAAPPVSVTGTTASFEADRALWTLKVVTANTEGGATPSVDEGAWT